MESEHMTAQDNNCGVCIHHWLINERNFGVCKKCGERKQFTTGSWYDANIRKTSPTKSSKVPKAVPDTKDQPILSRGFAIEPPNLLSSEGKRD